MGTIYITLHGETLWNLEGRMQGHNNSPLSEQGILQAKWLSKRLENVTFD